MELKVRWLGFSQPFTDAEVSAQVGNAHFTSDVLDVEARKELASHLREVADELEGDG